MIEYFLWAAIVFLFYYYLNLPSKITVKPIEKRPFREYSLDELKEFDGREEKTPIFIAIRDKVFDASFGRKFYGPGGPYEAFRGRDASRGLAKGSFDEKVLWNGNNLDSLDDLTTEENESLDQWLQHFDVKYECVGKLVNKM